MNARAIGELIFLALSLVAGCGIWVLLRRSIPLATGLVTRLFTYALTVHALVNLAIIDMTAGSQEREGLIAGNLSGAIFLMVYLFAAVRHDAASLRIALALALGAYVALVLLLVAGQMPFSGHMFVYATLVAGVSGFVAWLASHPAALRIK